MASLKKQKNITQQEGEVVSTFASLAIPHKLVKSLVNLYMKQNFCQDENYFNQRRQGTIMGNSLSRFGKIVIKDLALSNDYPPKITR